MIKIDMDLENKKYKDSIEVRGTTPVILSELTMVMQTLHREGKGFTKEMFDECVRLALQSDDEFKKEQKHNDDLEKINNILDRTIKDLEKLLED